MFHTLFHADPSSPTRASMVALILRVGLAVIFLFHGLDKIITGDGGANWVTQMYARMPEETRAKPEAERSQALQVPATLTFAGTQAAVAWGEFLCGLALALGLLTRVAALGLIVIQVGAIWLVTAPRGFRFERGGGYEYNLALLAMCLALLILGPGIWSLDAFLTRRRKKAGVESAAAPPLSGPHATPGRPMEQLASGPVQPT
ncbi:MAG TPA: DoxX family protein [Gemmataceae bacterium]|jgi:putative oxidoreductase